MVRKKRDNHVIHSDFYTRGAAILSSAKLLLQLIRSERVPENRMDAGFRCPSRPHVNFFQKIFKITFYPRNPLTYNETSYEKTG